MREEPYERLASALGRISSSLVRLGVGRYEADLAPWCEGAAYFERYARPPSDAQREALKIGGRTRDTVFEWEKGRNVPLWLLARVECRRCPACLKRRREAWVRRATVEVGASVRTWFCTLTYTPTEQFRIETLARHADDQTGQLFESRSPEDRFRVLARIAGRDVTNWMKRLRKTHQAKVRYLSVAERHKTGLPHWHMLLHETDPARPVRKRALESEWGHGFSHLRLVDDGATSARYVCKYLAKDLATRVRSSLNYGQPSEVALVRTNQGRELPPFRGRQGERKD